MQFCVLAVSKQGALATSLPASSFEARTVTNIFAGVAFGGSSRKVGFGDVLGPSRQIIRLGNPDAALRGTNSGNGLAFPPLPSAIRQPATFIA